MVVEGSETGMVGREEVVGSWGRVNMSLKTGEAAERMDLWTLNWESEARTRASASRASKR